MDFLKPLAISPVVADRIGIAVKAVAVFAIPFGIPMLMIYAFWKINHQPKEIPVTIEQAYPDEHLGI